MQFLLIDLDLPPTHALSRMRSIFSLRKGIYSPIEGLRLQYPQAQIYFLHPDLDYEKHIAESEGLLAYQTQAAKENLPDLRSWLKEVRKEQTALLEREDKTLENETSENKLTGDKPLKGKVLESKLLKARLLQGEFLKLKGSYADILFSTAMLPYLLLDQIEPQIKAELPLWRKHNVNRSHFFSKKFRVIGPQSGALFLHRDASILPGVVFDTRSGPIIIDKGAQVSAFSCLCGPLYVGPYAQLDNVHIRGSILGESVRAGGEIENSILGNFTNKHHEGFVGHSIIGNWVNLGALSTTSDLKNNYGEIRIRVPKNRNPLSEKISISTGRIKFGALIGDHVKTAIGTMINSGTVLDAASNIFGGAVRGYKLPFLWGVGGEMEERRAAEAGTEKNIEPYYRLEAFLKDTEKIAARRSQKLSPAFPILAGALYEQIRASEKL